MTATQTSAKSADQRRLTMKKQMPRMQLRLDRRSEGGRGQDEVRLPCLL